LLEFLVPDVLKAQDMAERFKNATFDRKTAIERPDADFLALGHPFVDAMLEYLGSYDFGGLTAQRAIKEPKLAGRAGYLFVFVKRERITREGDDECLFQLGAARFPLFEHR
jgi:RNA polymerase recycling family protein